MQVTESVNEMQSLSAGLRKEGKSIAFVPTMGYLHEGHLSLVDIAKERGDVVVVSIFVNPMQFGPNEDFDRYPRDAGRDLRLCQERGVDIVFMPKRAEILPSDYSVFVEENRLSGVLCGISRPQFFRGVCTIVAKLFNIVRPDMALFGQKDAQQAAVVKRMVRDLHFHIEIVVGPTVREEDGLAMSSRNAYLNEFQRRDARTIYRALLKGKELFDAGITNSDRILAEITHHISQVRRLRVIYVGAVDVETMEPLREAVKERTLLATAVWCDEVRLIDNIVI
jgi:pantoate--beta-alanine ligase